MTILKSISLIFLHERPPCLSGMCSNDDDDDDDDIVHHNDSLVQSIADYTIRYILTFSPVLATIVDQINACTTFAIPVAKAP